MIRYLNSAFAPVVITITLCFLGFGLISENQTITNSIFFSFLAFTSICTALFFPIFFSYCIIFFAPLSINIPQSIGNIALSLPAEGLLGILLLFSFIKLFSGLQLNQKILYHPLTIILLLDIIWLWATTLHSSIPEVSFKRALLKTSFITGFYLIFAHIFIYKKNHAILYILYGIGIILPILNAIKNHASYNFLQEDSFEMSEPFYEDHTIYGACIAFILPFFIIYLIHSLKNQTKLLLTLPLSLFVVLLIIAEFLSYSRAAWISVLLTSGIYFLTLLKIKPKYYLIGGVLLVSILSFKFNSLYQNIRSGNGQKKTENVEDHLNSVTDLKNNASNLERVNRWVCAYRMFEEKPILGWGAGTYQFQYAPFQSPEFTTIISSNAGDRGNSHSEYLTLLSEEGILGLLLFLLLIGHSCSTAITLMNKNISTKDKIALYGSFLGLITFYSHGFFNAFSDYEKMSVLVYGSLAIITTLDIKYKATK